MQRLREGIPADDTGRPSGYSRDVRCRWERGVVNLDACLSISLPVRSKIYRLIISDSR